MKIYHWTNHRKYSLNDVKKDKITNALDIEEDDDDDYPEEEIMKMMKKAKKYIPRKATIWVRAFP